MTLDVVEPVGDCIENIADHIGSIGEDRGSDIVSRLKILEDKGEYGYFDFVTDILEEAWTEDD